MHLVHDLTEPVERPRQGDQLVEHEQPGLVQVDHQRDVVVGPGRAVAAPEEAAIDVGQRVDIDRNLRAAGRDADGDGVACPVEAVQGTAEHGGVADAIEGPRHPPEREERAGGRLRSEGTSSRTAAAASPAPASTK